MTRALFVAASMVAGAAGLLAQHETPVLGHALGYYDARVNRVVMVGDTGDPDGARDRVWSWSGTRWEPVAMQGPPGRTNGGAAYERAGRRAVVAGGSRRTDGRWGVVADSWTERGGEWIAIDDIPARDHNALVEAHDGRVLMFGGIPAQRGGPWPADTFILRDTSWIRASTEGPAGRGRAAMAFDRARDQVVLFGGVSGGKEQVFFNDTWIWSGTEWRKAVEGGPRGRYAHGMVYDEKRGVVLMYSGAAAHKGAPLEDMWQWDGRQWTEIPLTGPTPGHRYQPVMVYDVARDRTVLYGGSAGANDTWEWDGARWSRIAP